MNIHEVDIETARGSLEALAGVIDAAEVVTLRGLNAESAALAALQVEDDIGKSGLRPAFERFVTVHWDIRHLDELRPLALAVIALHYDVVKADVGASAALVPMDVVGDAFELRGTMIEVTRYNVGAAAEAEIKSILEGAGHRDLANDLDRCADLYVTHAALLQRDQVKYQADDVQAARRLAGTIRGYLGSGETPGRIALRARLARATGLLLHAYEEVAAAGRFIYRQTDGETRFPRLRALVR